MNPSIYKYFAGLLLAVGLGLGGFVVYRYYDQHSEASTTKRRPTVPAPQINFPVGDFALTDRFGNEFHAKDLLGEVWVASFFYTECAGACIMLNGTIADLIKDDFSDDPVKFVSISVDPRNDTLETINRYAATSYVEAKGIDPQRWIFLTDPKGRTYKIEEVANGNFKVGFGKITHSDRLIIVDRDGIVRASVSSGFEREVERFKRVLREVLDEDPQGDSPSSEGTEPANEERSSAKQPTTQLSLQNSPSGNKHD